jgi:hypothetical protein
MEGKLMALAVCNGAMCTCSFGAAPSTLVVLPKNRVMDSKNPQATIMDNVPMMNIMPFGVCSSIANPAVAAATAAAFGVLTPQPCVPVIPAPWTPGSLTVLIGNIPVLSDSSVLMCSWAGVIQITVPGQMDVFVS